MDKKASKSQMQSVDSVHSPPQYNTVLVEAWKPLRGNYWRCIGKQQWNNEEKSLCVWPREEYVTLSLNKIGGITQFARLTGKLSGLPAIHADSSIGYRLADHVK